MEYISKSIENKKVLWFEQANQYLVVEPSFYEVFIQLLNGTGEQDIRTYCRHQFMLTDVESQNILSSCADILDQLNHQNRVELMDKPIDLNKYDYSIVYMYHHNNIRIGVHYSSLALAEFLHPKFAHIASSYDSDVNVDHTVFVMYLEEYIVLVVDEKQIGRWNNEELHFLQGKFAMTLMNCFCNKKEEDWLGVLHASAISFNGQCMAFLGSSGSGKSTATARLTMNGFDLLADDFIPISTKTGEMLSFPAAISIKESILNEMESNFPRLKKSKLRKKSIATHYKYLYPQVNANNCVESKECKAIVFIRYENGVRNRFEEISKLEALECLVPDSWISPNRLNVSSFIDWLLKMPCYRMQYSDNDWMIATITKMMNDEI